MNRICLGRKNRKNRCGHAVVEAALVLPLLILVTFGAVDLSQYINLSQVVTNASREGARLAVRSSTTTVNEVESTILDYLNDSIPQLTRTEIEDACTIEVKSHEKNDGEIPGGALTSIKSGDPVSVYVEFDFDKIRWIGGLAYWGGDTKHSYTVCRRE